MEKICPCCNRKLIEYKEKCCDECSIKMVKHKRDDDRLYNKDVRLSKDNKKYTDFYQSKEWKICTGIVKAKYHGLCLYCLLEKDNINVYNVVHHILEIRTKEGWEHRCDIDSLIPLCHSCHNNLHGNYTQDKIDLLKELIKEYEKIYLK